MIRLAAKETTENTKYMDFKDISTEYLSTTFKLNRTRHSPLLQEWLNMPFNLTEEAKHELILLRDELDFYGIYYNEGELKWKFINPLIRLVNYNDPEQYNIFIERTIQSEVEGVNLKGVVDLMLAAGYFEPKAPFFFLQEYKKEKGTADDVIGQLLSAMLVAQNINNNNKPLYGCYVIGRFWFFVVLEGKTYAISSGHVASNDDIFDIYGILCNIKHIIVEQLK